MAYQKPMCECGAELEQCEERVYRIYTKINKNGQLSKKSQMCDFGDNAYDRLICPECKNQYWVDEDKKGRIIRGEEFII